MADNSTSLDSRFDHVTSVIIGLAYKVANTLKPGFAEKCYKNALAHELVKAGLRVGVEVPLKVWYDGIVVGDYFADLIVDGVVVVEIKAVKSLDNAHVAQCINYLAATQLPLCLLINFGSSVQVRRIAGAALGEA